MDITHGSACVPNLRIVGRPSSTVVMALIEHGRASTRKGRMRSGPNYGLSSHVVLIAKVANAHRRRAIYLEQRNS